MKASVDESDSSTLWHRLLGGPSADCRVLAAQGAAAKLKQAIRSFSGVPPLPA